MEDAAAKKAATPRKRATRATKKNDEDEDIKPITVISVSSFDAAAAGQANAGSTSEESSTANLQSKNESEHKVLSRISASGLGRFFHLACHRFLSFSTTSSLNLKEEMGEELVAKISKTIEDPLQEAVIQGGFDWEDKIVDILLRQAGEANVIQPTTMEGGRPTLFTHSETVDILKTARPGQYIFQASVDAPTAFYKNLDRELIAFTVSRPDFLQVLEAEGEEKKRSLLVIDAKSSTKSKFSQQVQVAFYAILLKDLLASEGIHDMEIHPKGAIWLKGREKPDHFPLSPIISLVEEFLFRPQEHPTHLSPLEELLSVSRRDARWQMTPVCLSPSPCKYYALCHKQTEEEKRLGGVAYLSKSTHNLLLAIRDRYVPVEERISDIEDLFKVVTQKEQEKKKEKEKEKEKEQEKVEESVVVVQERKEIRKELFAEPIEQDKEKEITETEAEGVEQPAALATDATTTTTTPTTTTATPEGGNDAQEPKEDEPQQQQAPPQQPQRGNGVKDLLLDTVIDSARPRIVANHSGQVQKLEGGSMQLPKSEDVAVYLSVHNDPASTVLFAWGVLVVHRVPQPQPQAPEKKTPAAKGKAGGRGAGRGKSRAANKKKGEEEVKEKEQEGGPSEIATQGEPTTPIPQQQEERVEYHSGSGEESLAATLAGILGNIHSHNHLNPKEAKTVQLYIWDSLERYVLIENLKACLVKDRPSSEDKGFVDNVYTALMALLTDSSDWLTLDRQCIPACASIPDDAIEFLLTAPWQQESESSVVQQQETPLPTPPPTPEHNTQQQQPDTPVSDKNPLTSLAESPLTHSPTSFTPPSPATATKAPTARGKKTTTVKEKFSTPSLVVLQGVVTSSLALPKEFPVYSLEGCLALISGKTTEAKMDSAYIYLKWVEDKKKKEKEEGEGILCKEIDEAIKQKLTALNKMLAGLREKHAVPAYKTLDKFTLGHQLDYAHPLVSRMAFIHQYESRSQCFSIQKERILSRGTRLLTGKAYHLRLLKAEEYKPKTESKYKKTNTTYTATFRLATFAGSLPDSDFGNTYPWIITHDNALGDAALRSFDDHRYFIWDSPPYDNSDILAIAHIKEMKEEMSTNKERNIIITMSVKIKLKSKFFEFLKQMEGLDCLLHKRYTDPFTYSRELEYIDRMNESVKEENPTLCLRLLEDPKGWVAPAPIEDNNGEVALEAWSPFCSSFINRALQVAKEFGEADLKLRMTSSQQAIFEAVLHNRMELVWGPPGTGKTHFLALAILILLEALQRENASRTFTVVVTAFTHVAIENVLIRISSLQKLWQEKRQKGENEQEKEEKEKEEKEKKGSKTKAKAKTPTKAEREGFQLYKLAEIKLEATKRQGDIKILRPTGKTGGKEFVDKLPATCIIGGTVWAVGKAFGDLGDCIDLLVMDEASQVPVVEGAIPISYINEKDGRLVLAGDSKQLGTITAGTYPSKEQLRDIGMPPLHESIFKCFKAVLKREGLKERHVGELQENFRMNEDLCRFPREKLYGSHYLPQEANKDGRLQMIPRAAIGDIIETPISPEMKIARDSILDDRALVVIKLSNRLSTISSSLLDSENHIESRLAALITLELWENSGLPSNKGGVAQFWREKLFIVTPRHLQRIAVRNQLERAGFPPESLFVDTVEKMQGQETDAVVVCYGMWSEDQAASSAEFIFSLNRLNVSITRAKKKCIVILSEALLQPSSQILDEPKCKKGFFFLRNLVSYAKVYTID